MSDLKGRLRLVAEPVDLTVPQMIALVKMTGDDLTDEEREEIRSSLMERLSEIQESLQALNGGAGA